MKLDHQLNLEVSGHRIALDSAGKPACLPFVSHAHSDHLGALRKGAERVLASEETLALSGESAERVRENELDGLKLDLLPSGHMLGARQLRVEWDSQSFTYTGDFKLGKSLTAEPAVVRETDHLLMEGTFGDPRYEFPKREEVYDAISYFVSKNYNEGHIVLLGGYSLGKAQELVAVVNRLCGLKPVVHEKIGWACGVYSKFGVNLDYATAGTSEAEELTKGNFVAVMPFHQVNYEMAVKLSREHRRSVHSAIATGWAVNTKFPVDVAFPLSDHADFKDLLQYAEDARPKTIYCCHGNEARLSSELRKKGFCAQPAGEKEIQLCLPGF